MPLQSEPALLQPQGSHLSSKGADAELQDLAPQSGCAGVCAGISEIFGLICSVPGYWRLALVAATNTIAGSVFNNYGGNFQQVMFGANAASYGSWLSAASFFVAMIGAPLFGTWSDGRPRKISVIVFSVATLLPMLPVAAKGFSPEIINDPFNSTILTLMIICRLLTAPFIAQASGAPALWAWMACTIPQPQREAGFAMVFAIASISSWVATTAIHSVLVTFVLPPWIQIYIAIFFLLVQLAVVCAMPSEPKIEAEEEEEDPDPMSRQTGLANLILSPIRLVARKRSLRLLCGMAGFVTLPDIAVMYTAFNLISPYIPGVMPGPDHSDVAATNFVNWFLQFPQGILMFVYVGVGLCAKRFGPAKFLVWWIPINCLFFNGPVLLTVFQGPAWQTVAGVLLLTPVSIFTPLQALVALLVPKHRVGEAMGAVAAFKNLASLIAPLLMGVATSALPVRSYWILFPVSSVVMFVGAWPFALLLSKRVHSDTNVEWSVWSSVGGSVSGSVRGSARRSRG